MIILLALCCIVMAGGCPVVTTVNGSCCGISNKGFKFSTQTLVKSQVYSIGNFCGECGEVAKGYCDGSTAGGGWLVIQRRDKKYSTNFHRGWMEYVDGFGDLNKEFWYGLKAISCLTVQGNWELRVDFTFENGTKSYLHYNHFVVQSEIYNFTLSIYGYTGILPIDPFASHNLNGQPFSTYDSNSGRCAISAHGSNAPGGWWYLSCFHINLNYNYGGRTGFIHNRGTGWFSPPSIEMKIRPVNCHDQ